jgi:mono/diheme cytochrome c family protein
MRRVETRLLVKNEAGSYGVTYRWNNEQTDADLVPEEGAQANFTIRIGEEAKTQAWRFPGQTECAICHSASSGSALSFNIRQLNRASIQPDFPGNQLDLLSDHHFFTQDLPTADKLPRHTSLRDEKASFEDRARSYLAVNCAHCHRSGGLSPTAWKMSAELPLSQTGMLNGPVINSAGQMNNRIVAPGKANESQILNRMTAADGLPRMPLFGTNQTDVEAVRVLTRWIESLPPYKNTASATRQHSPE